MQCTPRVATADELKQKHINMRRNTNKPELAKDLSGAELCNQQQPMPSQPLDPRVDDILQRLERLESIVAKSQEVNPVESPYLNSNEAAAYLRLNVNALYSLVERRKLSPLSGHRKYRFTREMLDAFLRGD